MKKQVSNASVFALFALLSFFACRKEQSDNIVQDTLKGGYYTPNFDQLVSDRGDCPWTVVPAGSNNALAAAIESACEGGVVYLKAGVHTESAEVTVGKSVKILGEDGAILKLTSALNFPDTATFTHKVKPGLRILNAPNTLIQNVDIQPTGSDGGTAVLIENAPGSAVLLSKFTNFQFSILIEKSDRVAIIKNNIHATSAWQTGQIGEAFGIVVINGKSAYVADNEVENALFGIWPCDQWGTCERNFTHGNYIGIILCKVPPSFVFSENKVTGSEFPATLWKTSNNKSTGNFDAGYLVIDGANGNTLNNNEASNNGTYDIELTTDSYRFGFLTPKSYNNTVNVGSFSNVKIKDCGENNTISGGILVNTATDSCK